MVYAFGDVYFVICRRYRCSCGASFSGLNENVIAKLPEDVKVMLPFSVIGTTVIDNYLLFHFRRQPVKGQSFSDLAKSYREIQYYISS